MADNGAINDVKLSDSHLISREMQLEGDVDVNSGRGVAGWVLRIEGRFLDVSRQPVILVQPLTEVDRAAMHD